MKLRFDEVLYDLEQERLRVDEDLRRFAVVAAYMRTLLPPQASPPGATKTATLHPSALAAFLTLVEAQLSLREEPEQQPYEG